MTKNDQKWPKMTKNDQKWSKMIKNDQNWPKWPKWPKWPTMTNSRKSVRWSAVPVAPMWVYVGMRWLEGQRPRRGRWPMLSKFLGFRLGFGPQGWDLGIKAGIWTWRLGGTEKEKMEKKEKISHMYESIGHRPLQGRCPNGGPTNRPTDWLGCIVA